LRFSALSLRRTGSTPHSTRFARLELGLFTKPSLRITFYEYIKYGSAPVAFDVEALGNRWYRKRLEAGNRLIDHLHPMRENLP